MKNVRFKSQKVKDLFFENRGIDQFIKSTLGYSYVNSRKFSETCFDQNLSISGNNEFLDSIEDNFGAFIGSIRDINLDYFLIKWINDTSAIYFKDGGIILDVNKDHYKVILKNGYFSDVPEKGLLDDFKKNWFNSIEMEMENSDVVVRITDN